MKLIHITAKKFQSLTADNIYILNLAEQFNNLLGQDYFIIIGGKTSEQFKNAPLINLNFKRRQSVFLNFWLPYFFYFFWLPYFIFKKRLSFGAIFFSNDPYLLAHLIRLRKIFRFKYKICSDWHMLYNNWRDKYIAVNSDFLIATSSKLKNLLIEKTKINSEKVLAAYGGVDLDNYEKIDKNKTRKILNLPLDKNVVGYVGFFKTMGMEKGIVTMIKSLVFLDENVLMVFVGGKKEEILEYKKIANENGVLKRCFFEERKNFQEVNLYEQAVDVLVIPYPDRPHFRLYGFPMKVYEYMASQRPIVYSKLELAEEVLSDCGYGFAPDDPKDLAEKIKQAIGAKDSDEKTRIAYEKVKNYTWQKKAENIIEFIKSKTNA